MQSVIYRASTRGHVTHGWLDAHHTFSFANYSDRSRMNFGVLRVLNDDIIAGGMGFSTHPHDNMEIITIPLRGALAHKDSMGYSGVIRSGEVQVMSAGSGITHSEFNANADEDLNLFQIWIFPAQRDAEPQYGQKAFDFLHKKNELTLIVSPDGADESLWIYQDAWLSVGVYDANTHFKYDVKKRGNCLFAMVIEGEFEIEGSKLYPRDGIGITETESLSITALSDNARILLIDVPSR